jgi:TRAP-type C4-dicarboxylate transport system permease small subunit
MHRSPPLALARLLDALYRVCIWAAGIAITLMSLVVPVGVFMRYVLGVGARWPEPIAILLMVVFSFMGAAAAYRAGVHIAVDMFTQRLPIGLRTLVARLVDGLMLLVCVFVVWFGARLSYQTMGQSISELPWLAVGITYAPIPIGAALTLVFIIERMIWGPQTHRSVVRMGDVEETA